MKTLVCSSQPFLYLSEPSPWKPKSRNLHPTTVLSLKHPIRQRQRRANTHANAKGFTGAPASAEGTNTTKNPNKTSNDDDEEVPREVFNRIIARILAFVGVPLALGLALLHIFGLVAEQHLWEVPRWLPALTTFITFGASTMGIAYGALSSSWDAEEKGSVLGLEEAQKNWVEMWREEDLSE